MRFNKNPKTVLLALPFLIALLCAGCKIETIEQGEARKKLKAEMRHSLFVECMGLASKNSRAGDDDVSDIVSECGEQSYYLANSYAQ